MRSDRIEGAAEPTVLLALELQLSFVATCLAQVIHVTATFARQSHRSLQDFFPTPVTLALIVIVIQLLQLQAALVLVPLYPLGVHVHVVLA